MSKFTAGDRAWLAPFGPHETPWPVEIREMVEDVCSARTVYPDGTLGDANIPANATELYATEREALDAYYRGLKSEIDEAKGVLDRLMDAMRREVSRRLREILKGAKTPCLVVNALTGGGRSVITDKRGDWIAVYRGGDVETCTALAGERLDQLRDFFAWYVAHWTGGDITVDMKSCE